MSEPSKEQAPPAKPPLPGGLRPFLARLKKRPAAAAKDKPTAREPDSPPGQPLPIPLKQRVAAWIPKLQRGLLPLRTRLKKIPGAAATFRQTVFGKDKQPADKSPSTPPGPAQTFLNRFLASLGPALRHKLGTLVTRLATLADTAAAFAASKLRRNKKNSTPPPPAAPGTVLAFFNRRADAWGPPLGHRLRSLLTRLAILLDATTAFFHTVLAMEKRPATAANSGPSGPMLKFLLYLGVSWGSVLQHKLRSFLTVLGIIFGVAAVIAMTAIGEGGKEAALKQIQEMGINNIYINDLSPVRRGVHEKGGYVSQGISDADLRFIRDAVPSISTAARLKDKELYVHAEGFEGVVPVRGTDSEAFGILGLAADDGRILSPLDCTESAKTCVLGADIARELFKQTGAVGAFLRIADQHFQVAGVLQPKPGLGRVILIPFSSRVLHEGIEEYEAAISSAVFYIPDLSVIAPTEQLVRHILLRRHYNVTDFEIIVPEALLRQQERTQNLFNMIMILITGISLLVGGIGIMNIMLASVMERTKEIGIRRGMGATRLDIQQQFLAEAVTLTSAGGVIGVLFGLLLTVLIALLTGWNIRISPVSIAIAFSFSVFIGVAFGYYPARNASNLNPIDALRYE